MSADEFDPYIERLFARTPTMPDASLFEAGVRNRLDRGSRTRAVVLTVAGLAGGVVAVSESLRLNIGLMRHSGEAATGSISQGVGSASANLQGAVQSGLDQFGLQHLDLAGLSLGSLSGMQMFWLVAGGLIALAAAGVMRLSQEV